MAYEIVRNGATEFAVDWTVVARLLRANSLARNRWAFSTTSTTSDSTFFNPFSWSSPDVRFIEVDWDQVTSRANVEVFVSLNQVRNVGDTNMPAVASFMLDRVAETRISNERYMTWMGSVQSDNMARINAAVSSYDTQIEVAKFFRDTSADGLMVGATVLSGGAAAVVLGGGSALKGVGRWEDTGSVSAGVMTGVGNLAVGVFKMQGMQNGALAVLQAGQESATCLVEGRSVGESLARGSLKLAGPGMDKMVQLPFMKSLLQKAALPIAARLTETSMAQKLVTDMTKKLIQKQVVERGGKAVIKAVGELLKDEPPPGPQRPIDTATIGDDLLVKLAIVNQARGIGNGW